MKKTILSLFLINFFLSSILFAQENAVEKKFRFGLKLAPSVLWFKSGSTATTTNGGKFGFAYGLMADYLLSDNYSISTGMEMLMMNAKYTNEIPANGLTPSIITNYNSKYQFVQLPITIRMKTDEMAGFRYFGRFGFNTAICYKATADVSSNSILQKNKDIYSETGPFRFALCIGGGTEYTIFGSTKLIAGLYFDNSFLNMNRSSIYKLYNRGIVLDLGVVF